MQVTAITGEVYNLRPRCNTHVFVDIGQKEMQRGQLIIPEADYPKTIATILELPQDTSYIQRIGGLQTGDTVIFARYATEEVVKHVLWEDIEVVDWQLTYTGVSVAEATKLEQIFCIKEVHVMDVDDIEAVLL